MYNTHLDAEHAVKTLQNSGFNMKQLSIVEKDYHTGEHPIGYTPINREYEARLYDYYGHPVYWNENDRPPNRR